MHIKSQVKIKSKVKIKIKSGEPRACLLQDHPIPMGVCSLATSVAKKPADTVNGLSRHILHRQRAACLRYSTVPLTAPVFFLPFFSQRKPSSHWYTMLQQEGLALPVILALWPLRGSLRAFDSEPLNPWFRWQKIKRLLIYLTFIAENSDAFYYLYM